MTATLCTIFICFTLSAGSFSVFWLEISAHVESTYFWSLIFFQYRFSCADKRRHIPCDAIDAYRLYCYHFCPILLDKFLCKVKIANSKLYARTHMLNFMPYTVATATTLNCSTHSRFPLPPVTVEKSHWQSRHTWTCQKLDQNQSKIYLAKFSIYSFHSVAIVKRF